MPANKKPSKKIACPTCGETVEWTDENPWRPFCRQRCQLIDLGAWADESHRIPDTTPPDFADGEDLPKR